MLQFSAFSNYFNRALADNCGTLAIWHIVITGYAVISALCFLAAARVGTISSAGLYSRMGGDGCGFLVPFGVRCWLQGR